MRADRGPPPVCAPRRQAKHRKLPPDRRADLRHLLGRPESVEPRHQRSVQLAGTASAGQGIARSGPPRLALALQYRLGHFLHKQRNAVGALDDVPPDIRRELFVARTRSTSRLFRAAPTDWADFDLEAGLWIVPAERMKARREHRVLSEARSPSSLNFRRLKVRIPFPRPETGQAAFQHGAVDVARPHGPAGSDNPLGFSLDV